MLKRLAIFHIGALLQLTSFNCHATNSEVEVSPRFSHSIKSPVQISAGSQAYDLNKLDQAPLGHFVIAAYEGQDCWTLRDKADDLYEEKDFQGAAAAYIASAIKGNTESLDFLVSVNSSAKENIAQASNLTLLHKELAERFSRDYEEREKGTEPLNLPPARPEFEFGKLSLQEFVKE